MKLFLISALFLFQLSAGAQIYTQLKVVNGVTTYEATAEAKNLSTKEIHDRTIKWVEKTFLSEPVITQDISSRIAARYTQEYSKDGWADSFQHNLQIDIMDGKAIFKVTDTGLGLVRDGVFKDNLAKMRVMLEQSVNELFWSYSDTLKQTPGKE